MKPAAVVVFLAGTFLAAATAAPPAPGRNETAAERLGVAFGQPAPLAPAATSLPVVVLPKFDVRQPRIDLDEHELLTSRGRLEVAKARELSPLYRVTFGPLSLLAAAYFNPLLLLSGAKPNDAEALVLFEQDERLRRLHEADSLLEVYKVEGPAVLKELKNSLHESFKTRPAGIYIH